nr:alpha/beta hydrolase [Bacteroidota bacterium]
MNRISKRITITFVAIISLIPYSCNESANNREKKTTDFKEYRLESNIFFKPHNTADDYENERCFLDLYLPTEQKNFPVIIWFHGGSLERLSKDDKHTRAIGQHFAKKGIAVAIPNYRLSPKVNYPAYIQDTAESFLWVRNNIEKYGGDSSAIFVAGHSAGAYLVMMLGSGAFGVNSNDISGIVNVSGQTLTHYTVRKEKNISDHQNTPLIDDAAPCFHANANSPPIVAICGDDDSYSRKVENIYYIELLEKLGHPDAAYFEIKNRGHWSLIKDLTSAGDTVSSIISDFISEHQSKQTDFDGFPVLRGPYLGQKLPGLTPEIIAPGIISRKGFDDYGITFSRDQKLMLYTCDTIGSDKHNIFFSKLDNSGWTKPLPIPRSSKESIGEPIFSPISNTIYFAQLFINEKNELSPHIMTLNIIQNGWEEPKMLMPGLFASSTNDQTIYVTDVLIGSYPMEKADIVKYEKRGNIYIKRKILNDKINSEYQEFHPFVAQDERFIIFDSNRPGGFGDYDIYISFKDNKNEWGVAINLGPEINSSEYDGVATISTDGKYLFYCHNHDIYWVSVKIIEELQF